jgi:hypothetical protein
LAIWLDQNLWSYNYVILSFLFRLFLFYILFIMVRSAVRTFLAYRYIKKQMEQGASQGGRQAHWFEHQQYGNQQSNEGSTSNQDGETIEAEYRVVSEDSENSENKES